MKYRLSKIYETYYDLIVEADSLDEALKIANESDEWEEDFDYRACIKRYWAIVDEEGETEDDGELTSEQLP